MEREATFTCIDFNQREPDVASRKGTQKNDLPIWCDSYNDTPDGAQGC
ncbi:MAG: hypothetical protein WB499_02075 [Pseudolabrys sp.]